MLMVLDTYEVSFVIEGQEINMRVSSDELITFIRVLAFNNVLEFSAKKKEREGSEKPCKD